MSEHIDLSSVVFPLPDGPIIEYIFPLSKCLLNLISGNVKEDRMTTANSTFQCHNIDININI